MPTLGVSPREPFTLALTASHWPGAHGLGQAGRPANPRAGLKNVLGSFIFGPAMCLQGEGCTHWAVSPANTLANFLSNHYKKCLKAQPNRTVTWYTHYYCRLFFTGQWCVPL